LVIENIGEGWGKRININALVSIAAIELPSVKE
jgi:hypothetical protein